MIKFTIYVVTVIICGIVIDMFGNIDIEPQDIINSLVLVILYECCKNSEKEVGENDSKRDM